MGENVGKYASNSKNYKSRGSNPDVLINLSRNQNDYRTNNKQREESIVQHQPPQPPLFYPSTFMLNCFNIASQSTNYLNSYPYPVSSNYSREPSFQIYNNHPDVFQRNSTFHRSSSSNHRTTTTSNNIDNPEVFNSLRHWEDLPNAKQSRKGLVFSVMSYNVLAQDLLNQHPYLYRKNDPRHLKWHTRWRKIQNEIRALLPEIICFQEVQKEHLEPYFVETFSGLGYDYIYKQRTGFRTDGCAIFYNKNIMKLIESNTVEFHQTKAPILDRDNVAIIAKFAPVDNPHQEFVVATTHLLYNPKRVDVRLAQTQLLLAEIDRIAYKSSADDSNQYVPIILTGDLNSTPDSPIYKLLTLGQVDYTSIPRKAKVDNKNQGSLVPLKITDQCQHANLLDSRDGGKVLPRSEEEKLIELEHSDRSTTEIQNNVQKDNLFNSGTLTHKFCLFSVYNHGTDADPEGTTFQDRWISVDYIFYSQRKEHSNKLELLSRYRLPRVSQLENVNIPDENCGSDHLSLTARFRLK